jgi:hypothetical protein
MIPSSLASAPLVLQNYRVRSSRPEVTVSIIKLGFWCLFLTIAQPTLLLAKDRPAARTEADAKLPAAITALSARIDALAQSQNAELKAADSKLTAAEASLSARIDGILQTQETKIKALEAKVPTIPWWGSTVLAAVLCRGSEVPGFSPDKAVKAKEFWKKFEAVRQALNSLPGETVDLTVDQRNWPNCRWLATKP